MTNQPTLFNPTETSPTSCPIGHCPAIRFPGQNKVPTCAHDLNQEPSRRPKQCLNTYQPEHQEIPY